MDEGPGAGILTIKSKGPGVTPQGGQDMAAIFIPGEWWGWRVGIGGLPVTEQLAVTLADWLPGETSRGACPSCSFNKNSHWLGGWASVGGSVLSVGCR